MEYFTEMAPRFIITLVVLLIYTKLSGKSQMAPMSQLDQVGNMVIGALVGGSLLNKSTQIVEGILLVITWGGLLIFIRLIKAKNIKLKDMIDGKHIQLVKNGQLICDNFQQIHLPVRDFITLINIQGIMSISELKDVWYELNGSITIIKKGDKNVGILLIEEGCINEDNLKEINKNEDWLKKEIQKQKFDKIENIFCGEWKDNKLTLYPKE